MRGGEWAIADAYREPGDHGIPELPDWCVCWIDRGGIALARDADRYRDIQGNECGDGYTREDSYTVRLIAVVTVAKSPGPSLCSSST